jgi:predicted nucleic acid-binding protein
MILYLDTSALTEHYFQEDRSEEISPLTEKKHIASIFGRLEVYNRVAAIAAARIGILRE